MASTSGVGAPLIRDASDQQFQNIKCEYKFGTAIVSSITILGTFILASTTKLGGYSALIGCGVFLTGMYLNGRIVAWLNNESPPCLGFPQS